MDKENTFPSEEVYRPGKSILKSNLDSQTMPIPMIPLKEDSTRSNERRRVSFAPEVTLHKIDFVPQYQSQSRRRETIAFIPSQISDSSDDGSSQSSQPSVPEVGHELLADSSDEEVINEENDEQTMELTGQIPQFPQVPHYPVEQSHEGPTSWEEMPMELTEQFPNIESFQAENPSENGPHNLTEDTGTQPQNTEDTMEFTQVASAFVQTDSNNHHDEIAMEFTHQVEEIRPEFNNIPDLSPVKVTEVEGEMELTQSVGRITLNQTFTNATSLPEPITKAESTENPVDNSASQEPMKLTQTDDNIEVLQISDNSSQEPPIRAESPSVAQKRRLPSLSPPAKRNHPLSYTTTIPLADISVDSIYDDEDYESVSLTHFMKDIGIRFYDDLDIGTSSISRISISLPKVIDGSNDYSLQDYVNATNKLPLLELLYFSCEEMRKNIEDGKKLFEQFNNTTLASNPKLFKQYYYSPLEKQLGMQSEFQLIKDYCRKQAMDAWYTWRTTMIRNLLDLTLLKYEQVQEDERLLNEKMAAAESLFLESKDKLNRLKLIMAQLSDISDPQIHDSLKFSNLRNELVDLYSRITACRLEVSVLKDEMHAVDLAIEDSESKIAELRRSLAESETILNKNRTYGTSEIFTLEAKFKLLQKLTGFEFEAVEGNSIRFTYQGTYSVHLSSTGLKFALTLSASFYNKRFAELFAMPITDNIKNLSDIPLLNRRWQALKRLDQDIYKISLRYPVVFVDEPESCTIDVRYYETNLRAKATIHVSVPIKSIESYPKLVRIASTVSRGKADLASILSQVAKSCLSNELLTSEAF